MSSTKSIVRRSTSLNVERRFWATPVAGSPLVGGVKFSSMYSFFILDMSNNSIVSISGLDPAKRTKLALYQFPMSPQQYEISEPASTTITPTQDGGKFIESHGSIYKDIRIGGTVGFRPNPASTEIVPGLAKSTGLQLTVPSTLQQFSADSRGLNKDEATGFDDIIFLRNIFRAYWDSKTSADTARKYALVWVYAKESEAYIVEPMSFVTNRESGKPLSWTYNIQLRTLYPLLYTFSVVNDPLGFFGSIQKYVSYVQLITKIFKDTAKHFYQLTSIMDSIVRSPFKLMDDIVGGLVEVMDSISNLKKTMDYSKIPWDSWSKWKNDVSNAYDILTGVNKNETLTEISGTASDYVMKSENSKTALNNKKVFRDMLRTAESLLTIDFLRAQSRQFVVKDYSYAYIDELGNPPLTSGSPLNVANIVIPDSAKQEIVYGGESLRSIAKRILGDESYWKQLAILNGLKAPYIAATRSTGVLAYGDTILIPKTSDDMDTTSGVTSVINSDESSSALSTVIRQYGRDLLLTPSVISQESYDLAISQQGDLDYIEGFPNVDQAIYIKFSIEQGELATHPIFGARFPLGTKFPTLTKLQEFSVNAQSTIYQDPRVEEVEDLTIRVAADQLFVDARIKLRGANVQLPLSFTLRR